MGNIPQPTRTVSLIKQTLFAMAAAGLAQNSLTWLLPHDSTLVSFSPGSPLAEYSRFTIFLTLSRIRRFQVCGGRLHQGGISNHKSLPSGSQPFSEV